jgi:uncharacterized protein (DUF433 family)
MSTVSYPHIEINSDGVPIVSGTTTKVVEIVLDHLAHRWEADDICRQHPYLTLAQVHAALGYYYDHEQEINEDIERRLRRVEEIKAEIGDDTIRNKLRRQGLLP